MAASSDSQALPSPLLRHVEDLFHFARVLTGDAHEAARLVEATYRRLLENAPLESALAERARSEDKVRLYGLLLETYQHEQHSAASPSRESAAPRASVLDGLHARLTTTYVDRTLPAAFAALPDEHQLLLLLGAVEHFAPADAARVLDLDPATAPGRMQQARATLHNALYAAAGETERDLLRRHFTEAQLDPALRRLLDESSNALPPTLQATIENLVQPEAAAATPTGTGRAPALPMRRQREARDTDAGAWGRRLRQASFALLLIVVAGLLGFLALQLLQPGPTTSEADLLQLTAQHADEAQAVLRTSNPEQAERFVQDRLGLRLTVPRIAKARLLGAGIEEIAENVEVPVFLFEDEEGEAPVTLYTYTYAQLDRIANRIQLAPKILRKIEEEQVYGVQDLGRQQVLIWRRRDDIYVAVTPGDAEALRDRISWHAEQ